MLTYSLSIAWSIEGAKIIRTLVFSPAKKWLVILQNIFNYYASEKWIHIGLKQKHKGDGNFWWTAP